MSDISNQNSAEQEVSFAIDRPTEPRLSDTPRFGNKCEADSDARKAISQLIFEDFEEEEEDIPDEGALVCRLEPPSGAPLYTRNWCIQIMRLSEKNAQDL